MKLGAISKKTKGLKMMTDNDVKSKIQSYEKTLHFI